MKSEMPELDSVRKRVEKLEAQSRRLKQGGLSFLILLSASILVGQAGPAPRVVEAERFVLKDGDGNVRGWIGSIGKGSELVLGNVNAQPMMRLIVSTDASDLHFFGSQKSGMNLGLDSGIPDISMVRADGKGEAMITFTEYGPNIALEDEKGFKMILGATQTEKATGRKVDLSSVASILLLDKNKKIIWQVP